MAAWLSEKRITSRAFVGVGMSLLSRMALSNAISIPLSSAAYTVDWLSVPRCLRSEMTVSPLWMLTAAAPMWPSKPLPSVYIKEVSPSYVLCWIIESWVANAASEGSMKQEIRLS
jgi:hypothetical protein